MRKRGIRRLYEKATEMWRQGIIEGEFQLPHDEWPFLERDTSEAYAIDLARHLGRKHARAGGHRRLDMPPEIWSQVFAEAHRPH
jgi:hypothetical protein